MRTAPVDGKCCWEWALSGINCANDCRHATEKYHDV